MHNRRAREQQRDFHHVPINFPHVHVWFMNCDRPLKKEMIIWFVSVWQHKNFLGSENCISIWHPPNRDIREKLYGQKSSRTDPKVATIASAVFERSGVFENSKYSASSSNVHARI